MSAVVLGISRQASDPALFLRETRNWHEACNRKIDRCRCDGTGLVQRRAVQQRRCPGASLQPWDAAFFVGPGRDARASAEGSVEHKGRTVTIKTKARPSRRSFLKASAGTAALLAA